MTIHRLLSFAQCEGIGGHCFEGTNVVLASNPPQYPQVCKHCGATRTGTPREAMQYTEPKEAPS